MGEYQSERILKSLEEEIRGMKVGDTLSSERVLAQNFGVSRNIIREVLKTLSERGMIEILPGKGAFIVDNSNKKFSQNLERILARKNTSLKDIVEVREALETQILLLDIDRATEDDYKNFWDIYNKLEANRNNPEIYSKYDIMLHNAFAKATRNAIYTLFVDTLYDITDRQIFLINEAYPNYIESSQAEHKGLIEAVQNGDRDKIKEIAHVHFSDILSLGR